MQAKAFTGRCACGWELGANLSGDCLRCNYAISRLPSRKRRGSVSDFVEAAVIVDTGDAPQASGIVDDVFEAEKAARRPKATTQSDNPLQEAKAKIEADDLLSQNGFERCSCLENGHRHVNVQHPDWVMRHVPRDGHCLWHCLLGILQDRLPGSEIDTQQKLRQVVADFFEAHENCLTLNDVAWTCESLQAIRSGRDKSGKCLYYGGLSECVAFSLRFKISVEVYAPETMDGPFVIDGGGCTDYAPEVIIQTLGWRGNSRAMGSDHWQRMVSNTRAVSGDKAVVAAGQNCVVSFDGQDVDAKVVRALQYHVSDKETLVYCYVLQTSYGTPLGTSNHGSFIDFIMCSMHE